MKPLYCNTLSWTGVNNGTTTFLGPVTSYVRQDEYRTTLSVHSNEVIASTHLTVIVFKRPDENSGFFFCLSLFLCVFKNLRRSPANRSAISRRSRRSKVGDVCHRTYTRVYNILYTSLEYTTHIHIPRAEWNTQLHCGLQTGRVAWRHVVIIMFMCVV